MPLHPIRHSQLHSYLRFVKAVTTASSAAPTISLGNSIGTYTSSSDGTLEVDWSTSLHRPGVPIFSPQGTDIAHPASVCASGSASAVSESEMDLISYSALSADPGTIAGLVFGWRSSDSAKYRESQFKVKCNRSGARLMAHSFYNSTHVWGKAQGTLTTNGSGDHTIAFNRPFGSSDVIAVASTSDQDALRRGVRIDSISQSEVRVVNTDETGSGHNSQIDLIVVGFDSADEPGGDFNLFKDIVTSQYRTRILVGRVDHTSAAAVAAAWGGNDYSAVTDNGTGDTTITFAKAFAQIPVVVAMGHNANYVSVHSKSKTGFTLTTVDSGGTASDAIAYFMVVGTDYSDET